MTDDRNRRLDLTSIQKSALVLLLQEGQLIRETWQWVSATGKRISFPTIKALFDRYLITIVVESKYRKRHAAKLTDVGTYAAIEIERQTNDPESRKRSKGASEKAARFIAEITS